MRPRAGSKILKHEVLKFSLPICSQMGKLRLFFLKKSLNFPHATKTKVSKPIKISYLDTLKIITKRFFTHLLICRLNV